MLATSTSGVAVLRLTGVRTGSSVTNGRKACKETWETEIDFAGNRFLVCKSRRARIRYMVNRYVLLLLDYEGPSGTGLYWLFLGLSRLPMTSEKVGWRDELDGGLMLPVVKRLLSDLLEPFHSFVSVKTESRFNGAGSDFVIKTDLSHTGSLAGKRFKDVHITSTFDLHKGLLSLKSEIDNERFFSLTQIPISPADEEKKPIERSPLQTGNKGPPISRGQ